MKENRKQKVAVALSGGVDSSVAALLLLRAGYDVTAVFMKCWSDTNDFNGQCTWRQDYKDALAVARKLGIEFRAVDFESEYKKYVFEAMLEGYRAGLTPNPDTLCNKIIKFNALQHYARALGADWFATGHHARKVTVAGADGVGTHKILAGVDQGKDQSYFLAELNQAQLSRVLFPIGDYTKEQVRVMARVAGLPTADKRSSRGICFIGQSDFADFMKRYIKPMPGKIVDVSGRELGTHQGVAYFTIGQREGLKISATSPNMKPYYVVSKDAASNVLVVDNAESSLLSGEVLVSNLNWISGVVPELPLECHARIRYRQPLQAARLDSDVFASDGSVSANSSAAAPVSTQAPVTASTSLRVIFNDPQRAVTPGQVAALYVGEELVGSGVIVKSLPNQCQRL